ncbi:MAG: WG repeat-containing protein [Clostridia bacterium]|nr:WG repeat-containing protein [Clostridia bacterium]
MVAIGISKMLTEGTKTDAKTVANGYYAVYTGGKWGVINSKGDTIIKPEYEEAIIIPDTTKDIFLCTYDVDYTAGTYKTKVLNSKGEEIITGYDTVRALENYDSNNNVWYGNDVLVVSKAGKYGLVDFKGKELLKCEYDSIEALKGVKSSFITKKDGKLGLVDNIGATIIENEYQAIKPISDKFENGYIVTDVNKKMGVISGNKTIAVEVKYEDIKQVYGDGNYVVKENGKWKIVDSQGKSYLEEKFDEITSIHGQNVILQKDKKYGVTTLTEENKIAIKYEEISYAFEDNYIFKQNNKYGIINLSGEEVLKPEYDSLIYREDAGFFEGTKSNEAQTYFIGNDFEVKLSGILSELNITNGYMKIRAEGEYKYYNFKFEEKTSKELLNTNTLFLDKKDGKYGYVNKEGIVVVDYIYDDAREQNEFGYSSVKQNGMWGAIDSKGNVVITPAYKLENNTLIEFIGKWHRGEDLNLNYYTDE